MGFLVSPPMTITASIKSIALIYGRDSLASNAFNPLALRDALDNAGGVVIEAISEMHLLHRSDDRQALRSAFAVSDHPLVIGIANGRDYLRASSGSAAQINRQQRADIPAQPRFYNGMSGSTNVLLENIITHSKQAYKPVDVFLLVASRPRNLQSYANRLPEGSTLIAIQTPPSSRGHQSFWNMMQDPMLHGAIEPEARRLLNYYLICNGPMVGAPHIAVSGKPQRHMNDLWEYYTQNSAQLLAGTEANNASAHFNALMPYMSVYDAKRLTAARQHIGQQGTHAKPTTAACQAWAAETMWSELYGAWSRPSISKKSSSAAVKTKSKPAAVTPVSVAPVSRTQAGTSAAATCTPSASAADPARKPRLTNSQIGSLYKPGQPLHKQHPAVVRRFLHKG